jgi:hypothetical protein
VSQKITPPRQENAPPSSSPAFLQENPAGLTLTIRVHPKASKTGWEEPRQDCLRLKIQAPPLEGAANRACLAFLARWFGMKRSEVVLIKGERAPLKTFLIKGLDLKRCLDLLPGGRPDLRS